MQELPDEAEATVQVSAAVPSGSTTPQESALARRRAEATARVLRRMPDQDDRIGRVRVAPARPVARAVWVDRVRVVATWTGGTVRPSEPTDVRASAAIRSIVVSWQAPDRPGTRRPLTYRAYAIAGSDRPADWAPNASTPSCTVVDALGCTISGVTVGRPYTVAVSAANSAGESNLSPWPYGPIVPLDRTDTETSGSSSTGGGALAFPGPPGRPTGTAADREVEVSWTAPTTGGGSITGYRVTVATSSSGPFADAAGTCAPVTTTASTALSCTASELTNGVAHYFRVAAVNAAGTGEASASSAAVTPRGVPGQPAAPSATAGDTDSVLTWTAPSDGGTAITGYAVQRSLFGGPFTSQPGCTSSATSTAVTCTATGLVNGTSVRFRIAAINAAGQGPWSNASASITPYGVPGTPDQPEAIAGVTSVTVTWGPPSSNGSAITGYTVSQKAGSGGSYADVTGACGESADYPGTTACTLTGLTAGTEYFYKVKATNARGSGSDSAASIGVTPTSNSSAPVITVVEEGNTQLTVEYTVTASAGETVWSRYSSNDGGAWSSWANSSSTSGSVTITGLTNGTTYEVQLGLAVSPATPTTLVSGTASGRPRTTPGAPASVTGTVNDGYVALSWTAPASDGGAPLLGYLVDIGTSATGPWTAANGTCAPSRTSSTTSTSCNATGLTNGTEYYFRVAATNDAGTGSTLVSSGVTPAGVPDTPAAPTANGGLSSIAVTWTAPAINGSAITGYRVERATSDLGPFAAPASGPCAAATVNGSTSTTCSDNASLSAGVTYYYRVAAISAAGDSLYSDRSGGATLIPDPTAPDITSITPGDRTLSIAFTNSGSPTNVSYSLDGGTTWSARSPASVTSPLVLTGLANGTTYAVRIRMVLASGFSNESDVVPGTPRTTPSAPAAPTGTAGNSSVSLAWSAPADDGGASITGYTVQKSTDGTTYTDQAGCTSLGIDFSCTATGLTSGTAYTFKVAAINAAGTGTYSAASSAITPVAATCAAGGTCKVGDVGPGGGTVFYVASTPQSWGTYLETAPSNWTGGAEPRQAWASALTTAAAYTGGGLTDWRLGTKDELVSLSKSGQGGPFQTPGYWSSIQASSSNAIVVSMSSGAATQWAKSTTRWVRPIRAFGPTS
jgi:titin